MSIGRYNFFQKNLAFFFRICYDTFCSIPNGQSAGVSELADEVDSKSISGNRVRVQVPPPAFKTPKILGVFYFLSYAKPNGQSSDSL